MRGRPAARIDLRERFKVARGEPVGVMQERAKDEALAFLDLSKCPTRLRIEVASQASGDVVHGVLRLLGYSVQRPDRSTLIVYDD